MYRNLVNQKGSLTLTLPKSWVEKNKLQPKDQVFIQEQENQLIIESEHSTLKKTKELDVKGIATGTLRSILGSLYRSGYDELLLRNVTPEMTKESFSHLVGGVVTNEGTYHKISFLTKEVKDVFPLLDKIFITIGVALESDKLDITQFRFNVLELKDLLIRSVSKNNVHTLGFELSMLASELSGFASNLKRFDSFSQKQIEDYMVLQKAWLKRDMSTCSELSEKYYRKRKDYFYEWLFRVAARSIPLLLK